MHSGRLESHHTGGAFATLLDLRWASRNPETAVEQKARANAADLINPTARSGSIAAWTSFVVRLIGRQDAAEQRPAIGAVRCFDRAAMRLHDPAADGQPHAEAADF